MHGGAKNMAWGKRGRPKKETEEQINVVEEEQPIETKPIKKTVNNDRFLLKQIATQVEQVIVDDATGEQYSMLEAVVAMMNKLEEIDQTING